MLTAKEFIKQHNIGYDTIQIGKELDAYLDEMKKGLCGQPGSLLMLPSYLVLRDEVRRCQPVICVDAGGTNLRITVAQFLDDGTFHTENIVKTLIPGAEKPVSIQEFFDALAELIYPFTKITKEIAISFAYRAKTLPNIDCEIVDITKEVTVTGAGGQHLGKEICASLAKMGAEGCHAIVMNDSVATALAGKAEKLNEGYGSFTGTILGTGSNSCYMEAVQNIKKVKDLDPDGTMVINVEAGSYNKMPRSDIDIAFNKTLQNPEVGIAEKMTSGGYLGKLCGYTLSVAADEGVFEEKPDFGTSLTTIDVNRFLTDGGGRIAEVLQTEHDRDATREILLNLVRRAGRMLALQMAAVAVKCKKTNNRVCMTIEGTTYEKMDDLKHEAMVSLLPYLASCGIEADVISVDLAVIKGCAIAGLSR